LLQYPKFYRFWISHKITSYHQQIERDSLRVKAINIAHSIPLDEYDLGTKTDLYDLYETIKAIQIIELELIPHENMAIYDMQKLLTEKEYKLAN
jgi:hypothetical protein